MVESNIKECNACHLDTFIYDLSEDGYCEDCDREFGKEGMNDE